MRALRTLLTAPLLALLAIQGTARAQAGPAEEVVLFTRPGCPRCAEAERFLEEVRRARPSLRVAVRDVAADAAARRELEALARREGVPVVGVPAFQAGGRLVVGFSGDAASRGRVEALLAGGGAAGPGEGAGEVCPLEEDAACRVPADSEVVEVPLLGRLDARRLGLPLFTVAIGLIDGFNPCAMWVLLFLLSLLVNVKRRARMFAIGGTFVVVSGLAYYAFMAAWLNLFLLVGLSRAVEVGLGVVAIAAGLINAKDWLSPGKGPSLSIPEAAKPGLYRRMREIVQARSLGMALAGAVALAVVVNLVELVCTAGLPAVYTQVLVHRQLPRWEYHAYLGLYGVAYMLDDSLMLGIAVATLGRRKLQERAGRWLKLLSGVVMLVLGVLLIAAPSALAW